MNNEIISNVFNKKEKMRFLEVIITSYLLKYKLCYYQFSFLNIFNDLLKNPFLHKTDTWCLIMHRVFYYNCNKKLLTIL